MMRGLHELLMAAGQGGEPDRDERPKLAPDIEAIRLADSLRQLREVHEFFPGMIVRPKPLANDYGIFGDNNIAVVVEVLYERRFVDAGGIEGSGFRRPYDMVVGSIEPGRDGRDQFVLYHVDSRRFEPHPDFQGETDVEL